MLMTYFARPAPAPSDPCRAGDFINCVAGKVTGLSFDGGYAEYVVAPQEALARIPEGMDAAAAARQEGLPVQDSGRRRAGEHDPAGLARHRLIGPMVLFRMARAGGVVNDGHVG